MSKNKQKQAVSPEHEMELTLDDLVRRGARQVIQQAIETELAELLASSRMSGRCRVSKLSCATVICRNEMIQIDGSPHDWFEGRGDYCTLLVFIEVSWKKWSSMFL